MWLLVSSSEICWFSTASGGSALGRLSMFSSGVTSSSEVAPGSALHGDFSGGLVGLDTTTKLSSSELLFCLQDPALLGILNVKVTDI